MAIYQGTEKVGYSLVIDSSAYSVPIGTIISYGSTTAPKGFLICNGAEVSKTEYADLYSVIGDNFGAGSDTTKFKLPDLRDKFVQGANENLGTSKEAGLPNITGHFVPGSVPNNHNDYTTGAFRGGTYTQSLIGETLTNPDIVGCGFEFDASKSNSIYGNSNTVQPPSVCLTYIIKATKADTSASATSEIDDSVISENKAWSSQNTKDHLDNKLDKDSIVYGNVWLEYDSATTLLKGSKILDKTIKSANVSLVIKSDSAYAKVTNLALGFADKTLNVMATGMFSVSDKVCVTYIAIE